MSKKSITWQRVDASTLDLKGWKAAVIGGTGGLGRAISQVLAARGASVTVVGQTFRDQVTAGISFVKADLSLMSEAHRVAKELPAEQLDLVVFTTGIIAAPKREETAEGIERDMAVSYLNRLVILREIASRLGKGRAGKTLKPRVFLMGMPGTNQVGNPDDLNAEKSYAPMKVHSSTVAGNELLVLEAATQYPNAAFFGLSPGIVKTNIRDNLMGKGSLKSKIAEGLIGLFTPTPEKYATGIVPLLVSPDLESQSGGLFNQKGLPVEAAKPHLDAEYRARFLAASDVLIGRAR
jgi:NAD(P)-dependent dehydrogenase (short-subunit alcohol dehydrogenase family)